jgi:hypothetical protein
VSQITGVVLHYQNVITSMSRVRPDYRLEMRQYRNFVTSFDNRGGESWLLKNNDK